MGQSCTRSSSSSAKPQAANSSTGKRLSKLGGNSAGGKLTRPGSTAGGQRQSNDRRRSSAKQSTSAVSTPSATPPAAPVDPFPRSPPPAMAMLQAEHPTPNSGAETSEDDPSSSRDVDDNDNSLARRISHGREHEKVKRKTSHGDQDSVRAGRNEEPLFGSITQREAKRSPSSSLVIQKLSASSEIAATSNSSDTSSLLFANPLLPKSGDPVTARSSAMVDSPPLAVVPRSIPSPFRRSPVASSPVINTGGSSDDTASMTSANNQGCDGRDAAGGQWFLQQKVGSFSFSNNPANAAAASSLASSGRRATGSSTVTFCIPTLAVVDGQQQPAQGGSGSDGPTPSGGPLLPTNSPPIIPVLRKPLVNRGENGGKAEVFDWEPLALPPSSVASDPSATQPGLTLDKLSNLSDEALFRLFSSSRTNGALQRFLVATGCVEGTPKPSTVDCTISPSHKCHSTDFSLKRAIATSNEARSAVTPSGVRCGDLIRRILIRVIVLDRSRSIQSSDDINDDNDTTIEPSDIGMNPLKWFRYVVSRAHSITEDDDNRVSRSSFLQERLSRLHRATIMNFQAMSGLDSYEKRVLRDESQLSSQQPPTAVSSFLSPSSSLPVGSASSFMGLSTQLLTAATSMPITEILPGLFICCASSLTSDLFIRERAIDSILSCVGPLCPSGTKLFELDGVTEVTVPQLAHISHLLTEEQTSFGVNIGDEDGGIASMRSFSILASGKSHQYLMRLQLRSTDYNLAVTEGDQCPLPKQPEVVLHAMSVRGNPSYRIDRHFSESVSFLKEMYITRRRNVLVVCGLGVSRAPTIVMAFLCEAMKLSVEEALVLLRIARPQSRPNDAFLFHLLYHYSPVALL